MTGTTCRMADLHKVKSLLRGCSFGKFNFDHFPFVLCRTRYFPFGIFPNELRMSDSNSTCMWMWNMLIRLSLSAENPQRRNYLINHLSPKQGSSNRGFVELNHYIKPITFIPGKFKPSWCNPLFILLVWLLQGLQWGYHLQYHVLKWYIHLHTKVWCTDIMHKHFIGFFNKGLHYNMWATNSIEATTRLTYPSRSGTYHSSQRYQLPPLFFETVC